MGTKTMFRKLPYWIQSRLTPIRSGVVRRSLLGYENADALRLTDEALKLEVDSYLVSPWTNLMMIRRLQYHVALDRLIRQQRKAHIALARVALIPDDQGPSFVHMFAARAEERLRAAEKSEFDLWTALRFSHVPVHEYRDRIMPQRSAASQRRVA